MQPNPPVTQILARVREGDPDALDELLPLVYAELRRLAAGYMRSERAEHTLQPTALVHEAYLRLLGDRADWADRRHFLATAARAMRRILVEHARARGRKKRGGGFERTPLEDELIGQAPPGTNLLALDAALDQLAVQDPRKAQVVELLSFGGLTAEEAGNVLGVASRTVERDWKFARAWLLRALLDESAK